MDTLYVVFDGYIVASNVIPPSMATVKVAIAPPDGIDYPAGDAANKQRAIFLLGDVGRDRLMRYVMERYNVVMDSASLRVVRASSERDALIPGRYS